MPTIDIFRRETNISQFPTGAVIFQENEPGDCMYAVIVGEVSIRKGEQEINRIFAGEVFGEMALIDKLPRSAAAVAATPCQVAAINEKRFLFLVQNTPNFALRMMQVLTERIRQGMQC